MSPWRRPPEIGHEREFKSATKGYAIDRRNDGLRRAIERAQFGPIEFDLHANVVLRHALALFEIGACTEGFAVPRPVITIARIAGSRTASRVRRPSSRRVSRERLLLRSTRLRVQIVAYPRSLDMNGGGHAFSFCNVNSGDSFRTLTSFSSWSRVRAKLLSRIHRSRSSPALSRTFGRL